MVQSLLLFSEDMHGIISFSPVRDTKKVLLFLFIKIQKSY